MSAAPTERRGTPRLAVWRWPVAAFATVLVLLVTWIAATPRYGSPDELAHTVKTWATADLQTIGEEIPGISPLTRNFQVPLSLASGNPGCFAFYPENTAGCAVANRDRTIGPVDSSAATYPPAYYAVVGGGAKLLGADISVAMMRGISSVMSAVFVTLALWSLAGLGRRRAVIALLALTPMAWFMSAAVNPTAVEITGTLAVWCAIAAIVGADRPATVKRLRWLFVLAGLVVLVRPVALPWLGLAFAVGVLLDHRRLAGDVRSAVVLLARTAWPLAIAVVASAAWSRYAGVGLTDDKYVSDESLRSLLRTALGRTGLLLEQVFGQLGWGDTKLPMPAYGLWLAAMALGLAAVALFAERRVKIAAALTVAVWVAYPAVYVAWARTPFVWQGRYNLPVLGGVVLCVVLAMGAAMSERQRHTVARFVAVAFVVAEVLSFHQMLRRFMVGASGSLLLRSPGWVPPVPAWPLIALNLAAATALVMVTWYWPAQPSAEVAEDVDDQLVGTDQVEGVESTG